MTEKSFLLVEGIIKTEDKYKETIRCMSEVMTNIANELNIPIEKHGDPDEIFYAIEQLKGVVEILKQLQPFELVQGDNLRRLSPEGNLKVNSNATWLVSNGRHVGHKTKWLLEQLNKSLKELGV